MKNYSYELEGAVKLVMDTQTFSSGFTKREFVVTTEENYPQDVKFEVVKERCALLDELKPGDKVKVGFRIRGNEYKDRYYVNLGAHQVDKMTADGGSMTIEPDPDPAFDEPVIDLEDDMPF